MKAGIVSYKDEIMIKILDDFPIKEENEEDNWKIITLKKNNIKELVNMLLKEIK